VPVPIRGKTQCKTLYLGAVCSGGTDVAVPQARRHLDRQHGRRTVREELVFAISIVYGE
jgi:hypothetical protein